MDRNILMVLAILTAFFTFIGFGLTRSRRARKLALFAFGAVVLLMLILFLSAEIRRIIFPFPSL